MGRRCLQIKVEKKKGYYTAYLPSRPNHVCYGDTLAESVGRLILHLGKEISIKISLPK